MEQQCQAIRFESLKKPDCFLVAVGGGNRVAGLLEYENSSLLQNRISADGENGLGRNQVEPCFRKDFLSLDCVDRGPRPQYVRCHVLPFGMLGVPKYPILFTFEHWGNVATPLNLLDRAIDGTPKVRTLMIRLHFHKMAAAPGPFQLRWQSGNRVVTGGRQRALFCRTGSYRFLLVSVLRL